MIRCVVLTNITDVYVDLCRFIGYVLILTLLYSLIKTISCKLNYKYFRKMIRNVKMSISCMCESFEIWSGIIRINTDGKSLIMKLGPGLVVNSA